MHIAVTVKPNTKHARGLERQEDGSFVFCTKEPPVDGKANVAALEAVASYAGVAKGKVRLIRGATSRHKVFEIDL